MSKMRQKSEANFEFNRNQLTPVEPLQPPDSMHLTAAQGWLELGNHEEAFEEMD
jgi:hypothetical protein